MVLSLRTFANAVLHPVGHPTNCALGWDLEVDVQAHVLSRGDSNH